MIRTLSILGVSFCALMFFSTQICFVEIITPSIPYKWCVQLYNIKPEKGCLCAFDFHGKRFIKYLVGISGDKIENKNGRIYINGRFVAECKQSPKLQSIRCTKISDGYVFVVGTHTSSLDSRYEQFGLIKESQLRGKVWPLVKL